MATIQNKRQTATPATDAKPKTDPGRLRSVRNLGRGCRKRRTAHPGVKATINGSVRYWMVQIIGDVGLGFVKV